MCYLFCVDVSVSFMESSFNVSEGDGEVEVCVEVTGFSALPLTVTVSTFPDTAIGVSI